jgi:prophage antirepressor-like protein
MTNAIVPFNFEGNALRTTEIDGEPWFILADVCKVLDIDNPRQAATRLDEDEKGAVISNDGIGRPQQFTIINESGLYSLVLTSRKSEAKVFKKWITSTVIPSIRKTGAYSLANMSPGDYLVEQALRFREQERKLAVLAVETAVALERSRIAEARTAAISDHEFAVTAYAKLQGVRVSKEQATALGRKAAKQSKERGYSIGKTPHARYGHVSVYHEDILNEVFAELFPTH